MTAQGKRIAGRLMTQANYGSYSELIPISEKEWFSRMLYTEIRFDRDETGRIDRLIWGRGKKASVEPN
jgi:hypothetical protein